jgi:dynein intermediate chain
VYVYDLAEKLVTPRDAEWTDMQRVLQGMGNRETTLQGVAGDVNAGKERGYSGYRI